MDAKRAAALISENLTAIYGYSFARLYAKEDADELCSEIVCAILASAAQLRDEKAFWGFAWRIAENTFRKFIRKKECLTAYENGDETALLALSASSPEDDYIERETAWDELCRLRRELALLTGMNRRVTVSYYLHGKSCSEIAKEENISIDMVKYHLFKTRKLLKEGIGMTRTFGEKSYNPGVFRMDFWGDNSGDYFKVFERKLPGAIVLAAYDTAMTEEELVMELGVSAPYLEDELEILLKRSILIKEGNKYRTNIVILTDAYEKNFAKKTAALYDDFANDCFDLAKGMLCEIRKLPFHGNDDDENRLLWEILIHALFQGYCRSKTLSPMAKEPPVLMHGGHGYVFGYDNKYQNAHFCGITGCSGNDRAWFTAINLRVTNAESHWKHRMFSRREELTTDAILKKKADRTDRVVSELLEAGIATTREDGTLCACFPVFEQAVYDEFSTFCEPIIEKCAHFMIKISDIAEKMLVDYVPASVRSQCGDIAKIHHRLDVIAIAMECLTKSEKLSVPTKKAPIGILGVKC